jgi:hypothetical protein
MTRLLAAALALAWCVLFAPVWLFCVFLLAHADTPGQAACALCGVVGVGYGLVGSARAFAGAVTGRHSG